MGAGTQIGLLIRDDVTFVVCGGLLIEDAIRLDVGFVVCCVDGTGVRTKEGFAPLCRRNFIRRFSVAPSPSAMYFIISAGNA